MNSNAALVSNKSIDDFLNEGYTIQPHIIEKVAIEQVLMAGAPQAYIDAARLGILKAALLHSVNRKPSSIQFFFFDEATYLHIKTIIEEKENLPGIIGWLIIEVTYCRSYDRGAFWMGNFLESLRSQLGWNVRQADIGSHYIDVQFDEPSIYKEDIPKFQEKVEKIILSLSLQYRLGIRVFHFSCSHRGDRPAEFLLGPSEAAAPGFLANETLHIADILDGNDARDIAIALQHFYSQTTKAARIAIGWSCIEAIFGKGEPQKHLLEDEELTLILGIIKENLRTVGDNPYWRKKEFLRIVASWNSFKRKTRNTYIAEQLAMLLEEEIGSISKKIRKITELRSRLIHQSGSEKRISSISAELFIETALRRKWESVTRYSIPSWWAVDPFEERPQD